MAVRISDDEWTEQLAERARAEVQPATHEHAPPVPSSVRVASARVSARNGEGDGRSGVDLMRSLNGNSSYYRSSSSGASGWDVDLSLSAPSVVSSVEITVGSLSLYSSGSTGYSGLTVAVDYGEGGGFTQVYSSPLMYGGFDRGHRTSFTASAPGFQYGVAFAHPLAVAGPVERVRLTFGHADQDGRSCVSFNKIELKA